MPTAGLPRTPYVGLVPYSEADAPFFFGREDDEQIVAGNLRAARLTVVYGPSGVGKTSLLSAGVIHDLRALVARNAATEGDRAPFAICAFRAWRDEPLPALAEAIRRSAVEALAGEELAPWRPGEPFLESVRAWTERVRTLLVCLDQFEDYFLYHPDEDGEGTFAVEFPRVVNEPNLRVNFLLAIREDAWAKLDRFEGRIPRLFGNYVRVEHLDREAAREAIEGPISEWNRHLPSEEEAYTIEPELVGAVIDAVGAGRLALSEGGEQALAEAHAGNAVEATFLQLVMERLWRATLEAGARQLTLGRLEALGGAERIVESHLAGVLAGLTAREQEIAAGIFRFMVTRSKTKIAHAASDLADWVKRPQGEVEPVLERLSRGQAGRILRPLAPVEGESEAMRYELFHDVLAEPILEWCRVYEQERTRRATRRRYARIGAALLSLLVVFAGLAAWALQQRSEANRARKAAEEQQALALSRELAANSIGELSTDPELGLVLALEAARRAPTAQARDALRRALLASHIRPPRIDIDTEREFALSPDGALLVGGREDEKMRVWNLATGRVAKALGAAYETAAFGPDGRFLVAVGDRRVDLWSVDRWQLVASFPVPAVEPGSGIAAAVGPDGSLVVVGNRKGGVRVWDVAQRRVVSTVGASGARTATALFSPDGRYVAIFTLTFSSSGILTSATRLWDTRTRRPVARFANRDLPRARIFRERYLVTPDQIFQAPPGRRLVMPPGAWERAALSPDGTLLATASGPGPQRYPTTLWRAATATQLARLHAPEAETGNSIAFSPDGHLVVTGGVNGAAIWAASTGERVVDLRQPEATIEAAFRSDGRRLVTVDESGAKTWEVPVPIVSRVGSKGQQPTFVGFRRGRPFVILRSLRRRGPRAEVWEAASDQAPLRWRKLQQLQSFPQPGYVSDDGALMLAERPGGGSVVLRVPTGDRLLDITFSGGESEFLGFAPNHAYLLVGTGLFQEAANARLFLWDLRRRRLLARLKPPRGYDSSAAVSSTGTIGVGAFGRLFIWSPGAPKWTLVTEKFLGSPFEFSPDGRYLVGEEEGTNEPRAEVVDMQTGKGVLLRGHRGQVMGARFSADSTFVVTVSQDGTARIWDARTGEELETLEVAGEDLPVVPAFSTDDRHVITAGPENSIRIYACDVCQPLEGLIQLAESRITRKLTTDERRKYLPDL
jgi:WD40 repeat protein